MSILRYFNKHQGWYDGKRTPFGGGGGDFISSITDPISSVLGTDGSGGGILGAAASLDKAVNNAIPGGWVTVGGLATGGAALAYAPEVMALASSSGIAPEAAAVELGIPPVDAATGATVPLADLGAGTSTGTGLTTGAGATGLTSGGTVGSLVPPSTAAIDASASLAPATGSALVGTSSGLAAPATAAAGGGLLSSIGGGGLGTALGVSAGTNLLGSLLGANASNKAAQIQANAANNASQLTANMFNIQNQQQQPYRTAGYGALNTINSMLPGNYVQYDANGNPVGAGTGTGYLTHQFNTQDLNANMSPSYAFALDQGTRANLNAANALGGRVGGNALQGLQNYTQGLATTNYQNAFNNYQAQRQNIYNTLAGIAGIGQTAQTQTGNLAQNAAQTQAQLGVGGASALAAGQTGAASSLAGGATGVANNLLLASLLGQNQSAAGA